MVVMTILVVMNSFNEDLFTTCNMISLNIKLYLRILKYLRDMAYLYCYKNKSVDVFHLKSSISSCKLKQLLLIEFGKFPSTVNWYNSVLHLRIKSILLSLQKAVHQFGYLLFLTRSWHGQKTLTKNVERLDLPDRKWLTGGKCECKMAGGTRCRDLHIR